MRGKLLFVAGLATATGAGIEWWRRHPRAGADTMNRIINPWLVQQGVAEESDGEIGLLQHVGRRTGTVRVTPVHPVAVEGGYRIVVPLGSASQWARNVLAVGRCRLQIDAQVHELDEPKLLDPTDVEGLPPAVARVMAWLGFRYMHLHQFEVHPGKLVTDELATTEEAVEPAEAVEPTAAEAPTQEAPAAVPVGA
jgi:deazaflavin-dependent oxidoreductase (nitroreductase family)